MSHQNKTVIKLNSI